VRTEQIDESEEEARHRRQMEADDKAHQRKKEDDERAHNQKKELAEERRRAIAQGCAMALIVIVGLASLWVIISNRYPATTVDKAWVALTVILSGFVGFVVGQNTKK
jgi:cation transport ATPase